MNSVVILLCLLLFIELISWSVAYRIKLEKLTEAGGFFKYVGLIVRVMVIPELVTTFITVFLINRIHSWFKINTVENSLRAISIYELQFFPFFAVSFIVFNPVTQTIRYLSEQYPSYSLSGYLNGYIIDTYTWYTYFKYLFPIVIIGYVALNVSLLYDYLQQRREAQEAAEAQAAEASQKALALSATFTPRPTPTTPSPHLAHLKGKNTYGELDFPVNDVYYFTIEERFYYAILDKGRYLVTKTLNELEAELDPSLFYRIKRDYIVNRQAVLNYAYWENGKYIVRLNTPDRYEIVVPRARMQVFREWLQGSQQLYADSDADPVKLP
ncbi:hypothetical protein GCM10027341_31480 [Spirosoma knui]